MTKTSTDPLGTAAEGSTFMTTQSSIGTSLATSTSTRTSASRGTSPGTSPGTNPGISATTCLFNMKECPLVFFLIGGLIICCTILLISTLMLTCHVCHLSRRIKALSSSDDDDLISNSDYWTGTAKRNKGKSEKPEDKEASVLLGDISQAQDETDGTREENGTTSEDKKEEAGEGASATAAEESSSTKPQEEGADGQPTEAEAEATPASE